MVVRYSIITWKYWQLWEENSKESYGRFVNECDPVEKGITLGSELDNHKVSYLVEDWSSCNICITEEFKESDSWSLFKDIKADQVAEDMEVSSIEETLSDDTLPSTKLSVKVVEDPTFSQMLWL